MLRTSVFRPSYKVILRAMAGLMAACVVSTTAVAEQTFVTIGTGGVTGVYYPTGGAICSLVNKTRKDHGIRCSVESTGGSVYNINSIREGELDLGIAQSDWEHHAYRGTSDFAAAGPFQDLRSVFALHAEAFTVLARKDAKVTTFDQLRGKRVNIGNPGSGQRGTFEMLIGQMGWKLDEFSLVSDLKAAEQARALCDNRIDAMVYVVGHPNGAIKEATTTCDSVLVSVAGPVVDKIIEQNSFYRHASIPGKMYRGSEKDVMTFGVGANFVSSAKVPEKVIYQIVKAVFENFDTFKMLHPAFNHLQKENMVSGGLTAPMHPGAEKYFKEVGLLK